MPLTQISEIIDEIKQDLTDYFKVKGDILQLKAAEKGSPVVAKTIYTSILVVLAVIASTIALLTTIFALALIFIESGTDPFNAVKGLTFGALCLLGLFLLIIIILLAIKNSFISNIEVSMINKVIDQQEQKDRESAAAIGQTTEPSVILTVPEDVISTNKREEEVL